MRHAFGEFLLVVATFAAILLLPVGTGVAIGIALSLLHGMWSMTRPRLVAFERVPGTSIWWPPGHGRKGETIEGVLVIAFQAPLSFLNPYAFQEGVRRAISELRAPPSLIVLEASSIIEIDFTAAQILLALIEECAQRKITVAVARLESLRAQEAFERFQIADALPRTHLFHSVDEAIRALVKKSNEFGEKS
jgi:sulfate permease, SulP family